MIENQEKVSVIIPIHNALRFLDECFQSVCSQDYQGVIEVSIFDDASTDESPKIISKWINEFIKRGFQVVFSNHIFENHLYFNPSMNKKEKEKKLNMIHSSTFKQQVTSLFDTLNPYEKSILEQEKHDIRNPSELYLRNRFGFLRPGGVGFAKNRCVFQSSGEYLCFLDSDDIMMPTRISKQIKAAKQYPNAIIGSQFSRIPKDSTIRYTKWLNTMSQKQIWLQRLREVTVIQPTWFMSRRVFDAVGGYDEGYKSPEDLIFFYKHTEDNHGSLHRVDDKLLQYRYGGISLGIHRKSILHYRVKALEKSILSKWQQFTIWGAGRDGRELYNRLTPENQKKIIAFCDVDEKKIGRPYVNCNTKQKIPIIHFSKAKPPVLLCVKTDLTNGEFEENLASMGWREGIDYYHFS